ncbi:MAG: hypothetical protein GY795_24485 [Desulfobacterales bacterium]|nr:hypothetical protein [Desulfobacterales bacterium]
MNIKATLSILCIAILLTPSQIVFAGKFSVSCSYKNDSLQKCASIISDIVTEKFTAKFPATHFQIFVHSSVMGFTNGGYSAYAIAGVIPKNSNQFPNRTFSSTSINGTVKKFTAIQLSNIEMETYRSAVQNFMDQCEISPNCDVYKAYEIK